MFIQYSWERAMVAVSLETSEDSFFPHCTLVTSGWTELDTSRPNLEKPPVTTMIWPTMGIPMVRSLKQSHMSDSHTCKNQRHHARQPHVPKTYPDNESRQYLGMVHVSLKTQIFKIFILFPLYLSLWTDQVRYCTPRPKLENPGQQ